MKYDNYLDKHRSLATEVGNSGVIDLNNIDELEKTGEVTMEEISYEEFVEKISKSQGISKKEVRKKHPDRNQVDVNNISQFNLNQVNTNDTISIQNYSMHEINITQNVTAFYKPTVQIFAWTYNSGSFREFEYIESVDLNRSYGGISRQFSGKVQGKLTSPTKIWWYVNGDFYNNGTTSVSVSGGGSYATIGVTVTATFTVSYSSNHYKYWNNSGTYSAY